MKFNEKVDFYGVFSFKCIDKNEQVIEEYTEKNLIMDSARTNMAALVGGVNAGANLGAPINQFVIGTLGHVDGNVLDYKQVGEAGFDSTRTRLFSEETAGAVNYRILFDPAGEDIVEVVDAVGTRYIGDVVDSGGATDTSVNATGNIIKRELSGDTVTYTVTIPAENGNANPDDPSNSIIAYTEAALYAGDNIFSMKTFPARVKEDTVKFEITWSIIF